jgi:hypothetical protein
VIPLLLPTLLHRPQPLLLSRLMAVRRLRRLLPSLRLLPKSPGSTPCRKTSRPRRRSSRYKESGTEGLARAYLNAEKLIGAEKVPIPKDPNDAEAWERYYKAGGRPDDPAKYEFQKPEKMPDGTIYDENMETWWRQSAHEAGLSTAAGRKAVREVCRSLLLADRADRQGGQQHGSPRRPSSSCSATGAGSSKPAARWRKAAFAEMPADVQAAAVASGLARMPSFVKYLHDIKSKTTGETDPKMGEASRRRLRPRQHQGQDRAAPRAVRQRPDGLGASRARLRTTSSPGFTTSCSQPEALTGYKERKCLAMCICHGWDLRSS